MIAPELLVPVLLLAILTSLQFMASLFETHTILADDMRALTEGNVSPDNQDFPQLMMATYLGAYAYILFI